jgi:hypothetical protein
MCSFIKNNVIYQSSRVSLGFKILKLNLQVKFKCQTE